MHFNLGWPCFGRRVLSELKAEVLTQMLDNGESLFRASDLDHLPEGYVGGKQPDSITLWIFFGVEVCL
jgi:hypothetical protein